MAVCPTCGRHSEPRVGATTRPMEITWNLVVEQPGEPGPLGQSTAMTDTTMAAPTRKEHGCSRLDLDKGLYTPLTTGSGSGSPLMRTI